MPLREEELSQWFAEAGITTPFSYDTLPESPNRVYRIRISGGLGLEAGDEWDKPTFQIMTRGVNGLDARNQAAVIDDLLLDQVEPFYIGNSWVIGTGRFGGPPSFIGIDDAKRVAREATYWVRISRKEATP